MKKAKIQDLTSELEVPFKSGEKTYTLKLTRGDKKSRKQAQKAAKKFIIEPTAEKKRLAAVEDEILLTTQRIEKLEKRLKLLEKSPDKHEEKLIKVYEDFDDAVVKLDDLISQKEEIKKTVPKIDVEKDIENSEKIFEIYSKVYLKEESYKDAEAFADEIGWRGVHDNIIKIWQKEDEGNLSYSEDGSLNKQKTTES